MSKKYVLPADYIVPLNINGLEGRMLYVNSQAKSNRNELLLIYDLNSNLEQWWGLVMALGRFGNVTMTDLPGFGGMDSFYKIGKKPSIDNLADYLAAFVKLRYKRKKLSIIGVGFGFCVATRMLQRNPELKSKINLLICINGYAHKDDFNSSSFKRRLLRPYYRVASAKVTSRILKQLINNSLVLRLRYRPRIKKGSGQKIIDEKFASRFKIDLAKENDLRTKLFIANELLSLDNCKSQINSPLWEITLGSRDDINVRLVEQHLRIIFKDYTHLSSKLIKKVPLVFNDEKMALKLIPAKLRHQLKRSYAKS